MAKSKAVEMVERITGKAYGTPSEAPEGFKVKNRSGNPFPTPGAIVYGMYVGPGKVRHFPKKGKTEAKDVETFLVDTGTNELEILGAFQLAEFFKEDCKRGDMVWIRFDEQIKGGQGRVNKYTFAVKPAGK